MTTATMGADPALMKLTNVLGWERADALRREIFAALGMSSLDDPNDRLRFGEALVKRGGLLEAIGRSIKVQALLRGAKS